jgi:hypothetical protein
MIQHVLFRHDFEINNQWYVFSIVEINKFRAYGLGSLWNNKFINFRLRKPDDRSDIQSILKIVKSCDGKNDRQIIEQAIFEYLI